MSLLRICLLTQQYNHRWSGVGTYTANLVSGLADAEQDVTVICPEESDRKVHPKVRVIGVRKSLLDPSPGRWLTLAYKFARRLPTLLEQYDFQLVHFTDAREGLFCPRLRVPVIGTVHDCYFAEAPSNLQYYRQHYHDWMRRYVYYQAVKRLDPLALKKFNGLIANSRYVKESVIRRYHLPAKSIEVIYNGIPKAQIPAIAGTLTPKIAPREAARMEDKVRILFVGSNFQRKGLPVLIRSLPRVLVRLPQIHLYVIGQDPNQPAMQRLCRQMKIQDHVHFLGGLSHPEVLKHFAQSSLFVLPSLIEGFGIVFLEAMAAGVPVIGSSVGGTPELITDGVNGFLVKPLDVQDLAHKICMVLENKSLQEQFVTQGYHTLRQFTQERMVSETLDYYKRVVSGLVS